jgi:hypothetical protein
MAAGLAGRINRFDEHGEQTQPITRQHIGEQTIPEQGNLGGGQSEIVDHPPEGTPPRFGGGNGEGQTEWFGHGGDAPSTGVIAQQVDGHLKLGLPQPGFGTGRYLRLPKGQQGAVDINHKGTDRLAGPVHKLLKG